MNIEKMNVGELERDAIDHKNSFYGEKCVHELSRRLREKENNMLFQELSFDELERIVQSAEKDSKDSIPVTIENLQKMKDEIFRLKEIIRNQNS